MKSAVLPPYFFLFSRERSLFMETSRYAIWFLLTKTWTVSVHVNDYRTGRGTGRIPRGFLAVARGFRCAHVRDGGTCVVDLLQQPARSSLYQHIKQDTSLRYEAWNRASKRLAEPHLSRAGGDLWRRARTIMEISLRVREGKGGIRGWNSGAYLSPERSAPPSPGYWFPRRSFYFKTVPFLFLIKR